jgi:hypothetical protein
MAFSTKEGHSLKRLALTLLLALGCLGCGPARDPVRGAIEDAVRAARSRDEAAVARQLAPDYRGADGADRAETEATVRRILAGYDSFDIELSDMTIERGAGAALARFRVHFAGSPKNIGGLAGLLPRYSNYRFEVRLVPVGSDWKIAWAQWAEE